MALPKKLRPPLHAFIRHLLRDVLAQDTLQQVVVMVFTISCQAALHPLDLPPCQ
jgi:hypothetical protein